MWIPPWRIGTLGTLGNVVEVDPRFGIRWVMIPAGSIKTERGDVLTVARPFLMAETPVTQGQWIRVMSGQGLIANNPSYHKGDPNLPVESVTALEADEFSRRVGGRLPTEKEWEYAALGGQEADPYGPILDIAWVIENSRGRTHPVRQKLPNAFGLYDMLGNVAHWTSTKERGSYRVGRGGGFNDLAALVRSSDRGWGDPWYSVVVLGFRPVKDLPSTYGKTRVELLEMDETKELPSVPGDSMRIRMLELDGIRTRQRRR